MNLFERMKAQFDKDCTKYLADFSNRFNEFKVEMSNIAYENAERSGKEAIYEYYFEYSPMMYTRQNTMYNSYVINRISETKFESDFDLSRTNAAPVGFQTKYNGWHGGPMRNTHAPIYVGYPIDYIMRDKAQEYNAIEYTKYAAPLAKKLIPEATLSVK